jgi:predicted CXXCH cytochrome family protein
MLPWLLLAAVFLASPAAAAQPAPAAAPAPPASAPGPAGAGTCGTCHLDTGDDRLANPVKAYAADIHSAKGFGCVACHGGDATAADMDESMSKAKGYIGVPVREQMAQICGRCHSDAQFMRRYNPRLRVDQVAEYATSVHGRRLREQHDTKVAVCSSCHQAHSIKPPSDPTSTVHPLRVADTCGRCHGDAKYMAGYNIPTDQVTKYRTSVHWNAMSTKGDLSAPTCNDCHGNHGAAPPGISWVGNVCGQCHAVMAEFFGKSVHAKAFAQMGVPGCAACHDNHGIKPAGDEMVGAAEPAVCGACHASGDRGATTAAGIRELLDKLRGEHRHADELLKRAEEAGMEVSQARFDLNGATDALVKARAAVHAVDVELVKKDVEAGLGIVTKAHARGIRALDELRFRRQGLVVSLVIVVVLIAALLLKIRQIERRPPATSLEAH